MIAQAVAQALERGIVPVERSRALTSLWRRTIGRSVVRRVEWPGGVRVVAVGGATLGGSGKTPLAIACALELAASGARTTLIGHAYRARVARARVVRPSDAIHGVGDEALVAARAFEGVPLLRVVVAPSRATAVDFCAGDSDVLVFDGLCQTAPERATLALLAVDGDEPWGRAVALPPGGDLRAPIPMLLDACDAVVAIEDPASEGSIARAPVEVPCMPPFLPARVEGRGAWLGGRGAGTLLPWEALRDRRVGVVTALARSERVIRALGRRGVHPYAIVRAPDHGPIGCRLIRACQSEAVRDRLDIWLATSKCAEHVSRAPLGAPLAVIDHALTLHEELRARLRRVACLDRG